MKRGMLVSLLRMFMMVKLMIRIFGIVCNVLNWINKINYVIVKNVFNYSCGNY